MLKNKFLLLVSVFALLLLSACWRSPAEIDSSKQKTGAVVSPAAEAQDVAVIPAGDYTLDLAASVFAWHGEKVLGAHDGFIKISSGNFTVADGKIVGGKFTVDMNTISNTDLEGGAREKLVNHLKSVDFFNSAEFPQAEFVITKVEESADSAVKITGDLKIKNITKEISFAADLNFKEGKVFATAEFDLDRTLWDIRFGSGKFFSDLGDNMIDDLFRVKLDLQAGN